MKRKRIVLKTSLAPAILLALLAAIAWFCPEKLLTIDNGPVKADAMVVLGGTGPDRVERAAELFKAGEAPRVICSGYGDDTANQQFLVEAGIPAKEITLEGKSRTTRENAEFSIPLLRAMGARQVIIVTSWYHSRRALMTFEHYAPDIRFYSRPSYFQYAGKSNAQRKASWKQMRNYANTEYAKLLGYWVCYGICPF